MKRCVIIPIVMLVLMTGGCASKMQTPAVAVTAGSYKQITQDEAKKMMEANDNLVILDVRRQDEYDEGHIPGAICIPNESIGDTRLEELPDPDQVILVYCRSGRRSKEAAQKLADLGYTHIYEFGGIIDWTGDVVEEGIEITSIVGKRSAAEEEIKTMIGGLADPEDQ